MTTPLSRPAPPLSTENEMKDCVVEMSGVLSKVVARLDKIEKNQSKSPAATTPKVKVPLIVRISFSFAFAESV